MPPAAELGDTEHAPDGPDFEVWNYLESGWQEAYDAMSSKLEPYSMRLLEAVAESIVGLRTDLVVPAEDLPLPDSLAKALPQLSPNELQLVARRFFEDPSIAASEAWLRHAIDLEVARIGIDRAVDALERFKSLQPVLATRPVPENAREYMREVVHTYLLGFDAACIALCRACFDQLAKAVLLRARVFREPELRKGHLTSLRLVEHLRRHGLIGGAEEPARRLGERGNTIMHRGLYEERVLPTLSLDSIRDLLAVSVALASKW